MGIYFHSLKCAKTLSPYFFRVFSNSFRAVKNAVKMKYLQRFSEFSGQLISLAQPVDHRFDRASVKLAESAELMLDVICHTAAHPVDGLAEQKALKIVNDYLFVFICYIPAAAEFLEISSYDLITDLHEVMNENVLAVRVE